MTLALITAYGLSSGYDPQRSRLNFMGTVPPRSYGEKDWIDPLDPRLLKIIRGRIPYVEYKYDGKPITTVSQKYYNTTSLWWLILMFNGMVHQHNIPQGTPLKIPSLSYVQERLNKSKQNNSGKVVTI